MCDASLRLAKLQVHRFDDRPPSFNLRRLEGGKGCGGLLISSWNLLAQIGQTALDILIEQRVNNRRIEDFDYRLKTTDLASESVIVLRRGKKNYGLLRFA
jgi:hypothetical protein